MKRLCKKGFALPMVLWAVGILAAALVAVAAFMDVSMQSDARSLEASAARQLALSGVDFIAASTASKLPFSITRKIDGEGSFTATKNSDSANINLNTVLKNKDIPTLQQILTTWGSDPQVALTAANALLLRAWGAGWETGPTDFVPFLSFAQLGTVPEFANAVQNKKDWRDKVTLWGAGTVDMNYADKDVLMALGGLSAEQAKHLIELRLAQSKETQSSAVSPLSMEDMIKAIGLSQQAAVQFRRYFGAQSDMVRIESVSEIGNVKSSVQVIVQSSNGQWIAWSE